MGECIVGKGAEGVLAKGMPRTWEEQGRLGPSRMV